MATHVIDGPVKNAYLRLVAAERGQTVVATPAISVAFDEDSVIDAERLLGVRLHPTLLLLFSGENVFDTYDLSFEQIGTHLEDAEEAGVPASLVPLGRDGREWVCVARKATAPEIVVYGDDDESLRHVSVAVWLDSVVKAHFRGAESSNEARLAIASWVKSAKLEVQVTAVDRKPRALYRVRHAKFGEGVVRREEAAGADTKLEIDFGAEGVRILLARFVKRLDE